MRYVWLSHIFGTSFPDSYGHGANQPDDLVKQSIPFSYLAVSAASNDGGSHSVQVYSDISAEWTSTDNTLGVNWTTSIGDVITHQVQLQDQTPFFEENDFVKRVFSDLLRRDFSNSSI